MTSEKIVLEIGIYVLQRAAELDAEIRDKREYVESLDDKHGDHFRTHEALLLEAICRQKELLTFVKNLREATEGEARLDRVRRGDCFT